ncbi:carbohydrate kinase family protein [Ferruginibacter sp. SUN002]|uniref:carbohydrate kinase family protein n=1 Tax=Ferruginibacter sp. SUN002 TaxID=2937789 RepID=UPI003D362815
MSHIFIIGGTTFDHIISLNEFPAPFPQTIHNTVFHEATGSTGSGKALCLKKLDVSNTLYSVLGNDIYGQHIIDHLKKDGVDFIYDIDPKGTERHVNLMNTNGDRISMFVTQSSEHLSMNRSLIESNIQKSDMIILNIISYCKDIIPLLMQYNKPIWTDLHDYTDYNVYHQPFIDVADHIFLSSDNLSDYKQTMQNLMQQGKELVVCTHGKKGSTALTKNGEWIDISALTEFSLVDANGAGDNYFSGFLYAYLNGKNIKECMLYGSISGALCITSRQIVSENLTTELLEALFIKYESTIK